MTGKVPSQISQSANPDYGGVDFNPSRLDLETHGDGDNAALSETQAAAFVATVNIEGLVPVISHVSSLPTLAPLLIEGNPK